ncbi:hypothetical protein H0H87_004025 [Tephrocybe sp. NHM501043]|nr:hypothetical protein H0H87_004025 [Tephrocybe sp. NHM501043]
MSNHQRSNSDTFRALTKHEKYFINGGDLFFLAEHVNFRVHRYFFERESPYFQRQLQVPASPGAVQPGSSEGRAIILEEPAEDFAKFLWVFYNPRYSLYKSSVEDWKVILRLAHQWQFAEVKKLVVRELEKLQFPDVERIATYQNHEVDRNLLIPRYAALTEREQPLSLAEGMQLGLETTLMIARAREYARANPAADGTRSPTSAVVREDEMQSLVRLLFDIKPSPPVNPEDQEDVTDSGAGAGTLPGGLVTIPLSDTAPDGLMMITFFQQTPPPPPKPVVVIPTGKPTVKPAETKPTETHPTETKSTPPGKPPGKPEKGQQGKGKQQGKKGKAPPTPATPSAAATTTTVSVPDLLSAPNPTEEKEKAVNESLIDLNGTSLSLLSRSQEAKDGVNGVDRGVETNRVNGVNETGGVEEPTQNGDPGQGGRGICWFEGRRVEEDRGNY